MSSIEESITFTESPLGQICPHSALDIKNSAAFNFDVEVNGEAFMNMANELGVSRHIADGQQPMSPPDIGLEPDLDFDDLDMTELSVDSSTPGSVVSSTNEDHGLDFNF